MCYLKCVVLVIISSLLAFSDSSALSWNPPYYYPVSGSNPLPGAPSYNSTQQAVFWVSSNNLPEQTVLLHGAFSSERKTVLLASLLGENSVAEALSSSNTWIVPATSMGNTGLNFMLPSTMPQGPFAYEVQDASGLQLKGTGNIPMIYWTEGIASNITPATAPLHQVLANGVEVGGTLWIMGRDFPPISWVAIKIGSNTKYYNPTTQNSNKFCISIPSNQVTGTGTIQVGCSTSFSTYPGLATYGPPMPITIYPTSTMTNTTVVPAGLVGDGVTDSRAAIQDCINNNPGNSGTAVYITIPTSGTYVISGSLTLNSHQYLVGGTTGVVISGSSATPPTAWVSGSSYFGLVGLTIQAPVNTAYYNSAIITNCTFTSNHATVLNDSTKGHVVLNNVTVIATTGTFMSTNINLSGPDIQIVNSTFTGPVLTNISGGQYLLALQYINGAFISGNVFNPGSWQGNYMDGCQNVIVDNCTLNGLTTGTIGSAGAFALNEGHAIPILENVYIGSSVFNNILGNDCEAITFDCGGCYYEGFLTSSSSNSMVLRDTPLFGNAGFYYDPTDCIVMVLAGTGEGQYRFISNFDSATNTVQISQPWDIVPDTNSVVILTGRWRHVVIYGNTFNNTGVVQFNYGALDCEIANNTFENTAGILLSSGNARGYLGSANINVINNYLHGSFFKPKNQTTYPARINITPFTSGYLGGTLVRGNVGPAASGTGFLLFSQGGVTGGTAARLTAFLEEGESAPNSSAWNQGIYRELSNNPMVTCKENTLVGTWPSSFGTLTNSTTGLYGVKFTVGSMPITVTHVGHWTTGYNHSHEVGIYTTTGTFVAGGTVPAQTSATCNNVFNYVPLSTPVVLDADTSYYLESSETAGGERWYDATTVVFPGNRMTINGPVANHVETESPNYAYGNVNLIFTPEMPLVQNVSLVGNLRNNSTMSNGANFTVASMPMTVNRLGRWVVPGNSQSHLLQIFNAATRTQVPGAAVTVNTAGAAENSFVYGTLSTPVVLQSNTRYYLESAEVSGGDYWSDVVTTVVNPGPGAVINGGQCGGNFQASGVNHCYIPVNMLSIFNETTP